MEDDIHRPYPSAGCGDQYTGLNLGRVEQGRLQAVIGNLDFLNVHIHRLDEDVGFRPLSTELYEIDGLANVVSYTSGKAADTSRLHGHVGL